jgi:pimeloyl-ACP methyl ester carboxylesterase
VPAIRTRAVPAVAQDLDGEWRRDNASRLFRPTDTVRREETIALMSKSQSPAVAAALMGVLASFDGAAALARAGVPMRAITNGEPEPDLRNYPAVALGRTVGAGHFLQLEVPDQANAMIERFLSPS